MILIFPRESINARIFSVGPVSSIVYVVSVTSIILALKMSVNENSNPSFNPSLWLDLLLSGKEKFEEVNETRIAEMASDQAIRLCGETMGLTGAKGSEIIKNELIKELSKVQIESS